MSDVVTLAAEVRGRSGKGGARETRRAGHIPAVIYGNKQEPLSVAVDALEIGKLLRRPGFMTHVFELDVKGGTKERVLPRAVQNDPVTGQPLHVDFMRFSASSRVEVEVAVRFENEAKAPGLKKGGVLNVVLHTIALECNPDSIPESIVVDLAGLELGDVVHLDALTLPPGVALAEADAQAPVASITAPTSEVVAEEEAEGEGEAGGPTA